MGCFFRPTALVLQVTATFPTILPPPFSSAQLVQAQLSCCQWGSLQLDWVQSHQSFPHGSLCTGSVGSVLLLMSIVAAVLSAPSPVFWRKQDGE